MDINNVKILKKLGNGMAGIIYLVLINKKRYALKIEKIAKKYVKKNSSSREWREIDFALNFAKTLRAQ